MTFVLLLIALECHENIVIQFTIIGTPSFAVIVPGLRDDSNEAFKKHLLRRKYHETTFLALCCITKLSRALKETTWVKREFCYHDSTGHYLYRWPFYPVVCNPTGRLGDDLALKKWLWPLNVLDLDLHCGLMLHSHLSDYGHPIYILSSTRKEVQSPPQSV